MSQKTNKLAMLGLFIAVALDGLGIGILFPLLTKTLVSPHSTVLIAHGSAHFRTFLYGSILCLFFVSWFFGAVIMGNLSDAIGRKKALLICLAGAAAAYFVAILGFVLHSLLFIYLSRIIAGLTAGNQPIAQASIVDMSPPAKLTRHLGLVMMSVCLGAVLGPLIGSYLTDKHLISWFGNTTPLYFVASLAMLNFFFLLAFFHESTERRKKAHFKVSHAITLIAVAFKEKTIRHLSLMYFFFQISWVGFYTYCSIFLVKAYHFTINQTGLFLGVVGIGSFVGFVILVPLFKKVPAKKIILFGYATMGVVSLIMATTHNVLLAWFLVIPGAAGVAVGVSYIIHTFSTLVGANKQGWIMGVSTAVAVLAGACSVIMIGMLADFGNRVPLLACFIFMAIGVIISLFLKKNHSKRG